MDRQPGGLQSTGSQRVRHNWSDLACTHSIQWVVIIILFSKCPQLSYRSLFKLTFVYFECASVCVLLTHQINLSSIFLLYFSYYSLWVRYFPGNWKVTQYLLKGGKAKIYVLGVLSSCKSPNVIRWVLSREKRLGGRYSPDNLRTLSGRQRGRRLLCFKGFKKHLSKLMRYIRGTKDQRKMQQTFVYQCA